MMIKKTHIYIFIIFNILFCINKNQIDYKSIIQKSSHCPIDILSPALTENKLKKLINKRNLVRNQINNMNRENRDFLLIPVVFHNLHRENERSFCDYISGFGANGNYGAENNQEICTERALYALEILNEQFLSSGIQFIPHTEHPIMREITNQEYNHIASSNFNQIKQLYNFPNVLNIYLDYCIGSNTQECGSVSGMSTYPWSLDLNAPGIAITHSSFPGLNENKIAILPHEIGHYFSLLHINGIWFFNPDVPRELVNGDECELRGDLICDTPGQPGYGGGNSFFTNIYNDERICIYQGFNGSYNPDIQNLQIGGSNHDQIIGSYTYSNQDDNGDFWGTYNLPSYCFNENQEDFATNCNIENYENLPHAINFLQTVIVSQYCGRRGYHEYDPGEGYTTEQFENIRYSAETDYTGCINENSDNYSETYLINNLQTCLFSGYYSGDINQDNIVDISDITLLINYIWELIIFSELEFQLADANLTENINVADIVMIINYIIYN